MNDFFINNGDLDGNIIDFGSYDVNSFSFSCINESELFDALCRIKSKAIGIDCIPVRFIKAVYPFISHILIHLVNTIITTSTFPSVWKIARVVPIPKTKNVHVLDDLRPISILPALSKAVEHILKSQIMSSVSELISPSQFAYRRFHNTTFLLLCMTDDIREYLNNGQISVLLSLDLTKAFNSINFSTLINKLRERYSFSSTASKLILSYLTGRQQFVEVNGKYSNLLPLCSGVPQGSVLGPLLFILYINDLPTYLNSIYSKTYLYADDVMLVFNGSKKDIRRLSFNINSILDRFLSWTLVNSLSVNINKTKGMLFGISDILESELDICINAVSVPFVENMRCLGIYIDKFLNFSYHIDHLCSSASNILRRIYSTPIYLPFSIRCRLARSLLMSIVLYGLEVFSGTFSYILSNLHRIFNMIVRFVFKIRVREHISEYFKRFLGCSFHNYLYYRNLLFFYRIVKNRLPLILYNKFSFTHSIRSPQIIIPRIYISMYERSFIVRVARSWNVLPLELRLFSHSNNAFKLKLITFFSDYYN